jgi:hypothetical protein
LLPILDEPAEAGKVTLGENQAAPLVRGRHHHQSKSVVGVGVAGAVVGVMVGVFVGG